MKYEQFLEQIKALGYNVPVAPEKPSTKAKKGYGIHRILCSTIYATIALVGDGWSTEEWEHVPALVNAWSTGGVTGGSCWGGENHGYSSGNTEPSWDSLDAILEHFCPNITYLRYKGIEKLVTTETYEQNEYYGNSTNYTIRILKLKDLWNHLVENRLIESEKDE